MRYLENFSDQSTLPGKYLFCNVQLFKIFIILSAIRLGPSFVVSISIVVFLVLIDSIVIASNTSVWRFSFIFLLLQPFFFILFSNTSGLHLRTTIMSDL